MYKFGPELYEKYVSAKKDLEKSIKKSYENENTIDNNTEKIFPIVSVDINPETKSLDIIFYDNVKNNTTELERYKTMIKEILSDEIVWNLSFLDDKLD